MSRCPLVNDPNLQYIGIRMDHQLNVRSSLKCLGLFLALVVLGANVRAQIPEYFEQDQMWRVDQSSADGTCAFYYESSYYVDGDTTIGQHHYKQLGVRGRHWEEFIGTGQGQGICNTSDIYFDEQFCHIRQSSDSVFVRDWMFGGWSERLLISYNMDVGDTLLYLGQWNEVVHTIDTVVINGTAHRRFYFDVQQQHYLIEGVVDVEYQGQSWPLFADFLGGNIGPLDVICFSENDSTVWTSPHAEFSTCDYFIPLGVEEVGRASFDPLIFPNPTSTYLNIDMQEPITYSIALFDVMGEQVVFELNAKAVDLSGLANGTYVAEVKDRGTGRSVREKIIVVH